MADSEREAQARVDQIVADLADFFAVKLEQRTFYQEDVCRPGWIGSTPEPPAASLYKPNERKE